MPRRLGLGCVALVLAAQAGCGRAGDRTQVRAATESFYAAVRGDDGERACSQLSDDAVDVLEKRSTLECHALITGLQYQGGHVVRVEVYVTNAKVDLDSGESAFLSKEPSGWRLSAVACSPAEGKPRDRPLTCELAA